MRYQDLTRDQLIEELEDLKMQLTELKESNSRLIDAEKNIRAIFDASSESFFLMKADGETLSVNKVFTQRMRLNEEDIIGKNIYDLLRLEVAERRKKWVQTVLETGRPFHAVDERDGILQHHHLQPIFDDSGKVDRLVAYVSNITEQHSTQKDLAQSRRNYRLLFQNMIEGLAYCQMLYDKGQPTDFVYLDVNDSFEKLTGLKNVIGKRVSQIIPGIIDLDYPLLEIYDRVISTGIPERFEFYLESMGIWFSVSAYGVGNDKFVAVFDNITDRKLAQKELQESEKKFRRLIETANEGICVIDEHHRTTFINRKMLDMLGYSEHEIIGVPCENFLFEEDLVEQKQRMCARHEGKNDSYEIRIRRKDGQAIWALVCSTAILDDEGGFRGSVGMLTDITEMKKSVEALSESEQRFKAVVDNIEIGISLLNSNLEIVEVNKAFKTYFPHVKPGSGQLCYEHFNDPPLSSPCEHCPCALTLQDGKVHEVVTDTPAGTEIRNYRLVASPIKNNQGEITHVIELTEDITDSLRAAEKLKTEKDQLKNILDNMNDGVYIVDRNYDIEYVNPVLEAEFGPSQGKKCYSYFHERSEPCTWCPNHEVFQGKTVNWEWTSPKTGKVYELFDTPIINADGTVSKLEIFHEITERKKTEEKLLQSEEKLRLKLDSILRPESELTSEELSNFLDTDHIKLLLDAFSKLTQTPVTIVDLEENVIMASGWQDVCSAFHRKHPLSLKNCVESNPGCFKQMKPEEILSYRCNNNLNHLSAPLYLADKIVGTIHIGQFLYDDQTDLEPFQYQAEQFGFDKNAYMAALAKVPRFSREQARTIMTYLLKFTTLISRLSVANLELARAISTQKQNEEQIRKNQDELRLIVENVPVIVFNSSGDVLETPYVNSKFTEILGYDLNELKQADNWWALAYPDENYRKQVMREWNSRVQVAISKKTSIRPLEVKVRCKDGTDKIIEWGFVSTGDMNLGFGVDLTQRKLDEAEKTSLQEKFLQAQKMEAIGNLSGGIAHDFNNLLQVIIGYSELMLQQEDLPKKFKNDVEKVFRASLDGADLVKQLLLFSRKSPIAVTPINLNQKILRIRKLLFRTIPKMIDIDLKLADDLPTIKADKTQLEQVLINLAINARDAMPNGGKLIIETSLIRLEENSLPDQLVSRPGDYVRLGVSDTGTGIERELLKRIFEPFFTTKEVGKGTGLGLAVVYGIVHQHGGYMSCSSEPGHGTTFDIYFPVTNGDVCATESRMPQRLAPVGCNETILIVDDDETVRSLAARLLKLSGYDILEAEDGVKAMDIYRRMGQNIDLVILDLVMPNMGGMECMEKLLEINPDTRILIATGYSEEGSEHKLLDKGAKDVITKPYSKFDLLENIRSVLDS
ncbi:MAG: PAS domain S-box protein [Syntrophaceae bacterium]|nr:PAS domain S-box protein [Syntrophaceae bacterium]